MIRVVLDSNVYVSALLFGGNPRLVLQLSEAGVFEVAVSPWICAEVEETLRDKFRWTDARIRAAAGAFWDRALRVAPSAMMEIRDSSDPDDNRVLECALACEARWIVTGDQHLLRLDPWRGVSILTPRGFLETRPWVGS